MGIELLPQFIRDNYEHKEWKHACAILVQDFPNEWRDIIDILEGFRLSTASVAGKGKNKSEISKLIDGEFYKRDWKEKKFATKIVVDGVSTDSPTHKVDCFKNGIALEIEWNNKDPFYDRDLNNFRLLFDLRVVSVGVIITRADELQDLFDELGKGSSYGNSTTHWSKLVPRIEGRGGAGCPILAFGIKRSLCVDDLPTPLGL